MDGHYDPSVDIVLLRFDGWERGQTRVEETPGGLVERDRSTGAVVGLEFWHASEQLPSDLLDALPAPPGEEVVLEKQSV